MECGNASYRFDCFCSCSNRRCCNLASAILSYICPTNRSRVSPHDSESRRTTPESRRATPKSRRATPVSRRTTPESRRATPTSRRATPGSHRATPESRRATPESRRATPESRRTTPESRRATSESRRTTPESRRATPESRRTTSESRRTTSESRRTTSESRLSALRATFASSLECGDRSHRFDWVPETLNAQSGSCGCRRKSGHRYEFLPPELTGKIEDMGITSPGSDDDGEPDDVRYHVDGDSGRIDYTASVPRGAYNLWRRGDDRRPLLVQAFASWPEACPPCGIASHATMLRSTGLRWTVARRHSRNAIRPREPARANCKGQLSGWIE